MDVGGKRNGQLGPSAFGSWSDVSLIAGWDGWVAYRTRRYVK